MRLNKEEAAQVAMQLKRHNRESGYKEIVLDEKQKKKIRLWISKGDFGSDFMSSAIYLAKFLHRSSSLYKGKVCLDMFCGAGIQGLVLAQEAKEVDLADINPVSIEDSKRNVIEKGVSNKCHVYSEGNLFENIPRNRQYDVIVGNHPFFAEKPENFGKVVCDDIRVRASMLGGTSLIKKFFTQALQHLEQKGIVIMPYYHGARRFNDPAIHALVYGLDIIKHESYKPTEGVQLSHPISIYVMGRK